MELTDTSSLTCSLEFGFFRVWLDCLGFLMINQAKQNEIVQHTCFTEFEPNQEIHKFILFQLDVDNELQILLIFIESFVIEICCILSSQYDFSRCL